jgi:hypothetical protein
VLAGLILVACWFPVTMADQPRWLSHSREDAVRFNYTFHPAVSVDQNADFPELSGLRLEFSRIEFGLAIPIVFAQGRTVIVNALSYEGLTFNYLEDPQVQALRPDALHDIRYVLAFSFSPTESRQWNVLLRPGIVSDYEEIESDDFTVESTVIHTWSVGDHAAIGTGIGYLSHLGKPLPMPVLKYRWADKQFDFELFLPVRGSIDWKLSPSLTTRLTAEIDGNNYFVGEDFALTETLNASGGDIELSMLNVGSELKINPAGGLNLRIGGGVSLLYRYTYSDSFDRETLDLSTKPGFFIQAGFSYYH